MKGEPPRLTPRQREVLTLIADGLADREIGERLGISYRTVRSHVEALEAAFGVTNGAGLVGRWLRPERRLE